MSAGALASPAQGPAAPVYSIADGHRAQAESTAWARFAAAADDAEFVAAWLGLLGLRVQHARAALVLVGEHETGPFTVAAAWPDPQRDLQYLGAVAQRALSERRGIVAGRDGGDTAAGGAAHVAYPLEVGGRLRGAVVLDVDGGTPAELQAVLRQVHWASAWLVDHFRQQQLEAAEAALSRVVLLDGLMATALQQRRLRPAALAVANELAARLQCDRVSVGFVQDDHVTPSTMSHTASFDPRSDLVRALAEAMDEALDLGVVVSVPRPPDDELGALAHEQAARLLGAQAMLSLPVVHETRTVAVLTLERRSGAAFTPAERQLVAAVAAMLGPVWSLQRQAERTTPQRLRDGWHDALRAVAGPRHPGLKAAAVLLAAGLAALATWQVEHRVAARTVVEGSTQMASVAPFEGFIAEAPVRAGDTVRRGQPLARLEDRDLQLERARWLAEQAQAQRKFQIAMAQADRGTMGVLAAQAQQAEAQLALVDEKLSRARLVAPFDGIVVAGDLSQSIGMPVEQGRVLFEVAPLQGFRVVLQVDERDIGRLAVGQRGELVLASQPGRTLPFTVGTITSVATPQDGHNVFRVEAAVQGAPARLRPGMEGIGKVVVGQRSLLWIWTHGFFDALRLALWSWLP